MNKKIIKIVFMQTMIISMRLIGVKRVGVVVLVMNFRFLILFMYLTGAGNNFMNS